MEENIQKESSASCRILITNDDGIQAKGLHSLVSYVCDMGEVLVVAPDSARSGQSGAITSNVPLRMECVGEEENVRYYTCSGTPVDCVKLALHCFPDFRPDLVLSGINHGSNSSINIFYSGTMGAALEGCIAGIPSIGFSLLTHDADADFLPSRDYVRKICKMVIDKGLPPMVCLNVNIPVGEIMGLKVCRQARGYWSEEYRPCVDADGKEVYWLTGYYVNVDTDADDTDEAALAQSFISIVPSTCDQTAHWSVSSLQKLVEKE